jgi:uncharacterized protein (TIGR00299 family) protein
MSQRFAVIDPAAGASGDMLLGALIDAGASVDLLRSLPARLGLSEVTINVEKVRRCGMMATRVEVQLSHSTPPDDQHLQLHSHGDGHQHAHAHGNHHHPAEIFHRLQHAAISNSVRAKACEAFQLLCAAEADVHGMAVESVVLHEVGAADALVDLVGVLEGFEELGISEIAVLPIAVGDGWVKTAHGMLPVPAPATQRLLQGMTIAHGAPVTGEAVTPTGAVLLRVLQTIALPPRWRAQATGWGAGGRDPGHYPNTLRLILAERADEAGQVVTLSSDMDDLSPEYIEPLREALFAAGALDVVVWGTQMKKGRPGVRVEVTCDTPSTDAVTEAFFLHSTTAGIRRSVLERVTLARRMIEVPAPDGVLIPVKVLDTPAGPRVKPEYEAVRDAARRLGRPALDVAQEVEWQARTLVARPPAEHHH